VVAVHLEKGGCCVAGGQATKMASGRGVLGWVREQGATYTFSPDDRAQRDKVGSPYTDEKDFDINFTRGTHQKVSHL